MARQLKRWESPRREGRNDKGRGGSARQRQRRKQFQALRQKLKEQASDRDHPKPKPDHSSNQLRGSHDASLFYGSYLRLRLRIAASGRIGNLNLVDVPQTPTG